MRNISKSQSLNLEKIEKKHWFEHISTNSRARHPIFSAVSYDFTILGLLGHPTSQSHPKSHSLIHLQQHSHRQLTSSHIYRYTHSYINWSQSHPTLTIGVVNKVITCMGRRHDSYTPYELLNSLYIFRLKRTSLQLFWFFYKWNFDDNIVFYFEIASKLFIKRASLERLNIYKQ